MKMKFKAYYVVLISLIINSISYGQDICAHATRVISLTNCEFQESFGTFNEANNVISYCNGGNTGFTGNEVIYAFVPIQSRAYTFTLTGVSAGKDLDMFLVNGCNDNTCLADTDGASSSTTDAFTIDLDASTIYYLSVDTDEVSGTGESNYTLSVSCDIGPGLSCGGFKEMECDRLYQDANVSGDNDATDILDDHGTCTGVNNNSQFKRHEVIYNFRATDHGLRHVTIDLNTHTSNVDLDLFIYDDCVVNTVNNQDEYHMDDCLTASSHTSGTESVFISAFAPNAGVYVVVDGQSNNQNGVINESSFEVYVSCGAPCDFGTEAIACNSSVSGSTIGQKNHSSYYSCDPEDNRGNNWGPEKVYRFELDSREEITFDLDVHSQVDLNLYLLKGSCDVTKCVDLSKKIGNGQDEKIVRTLDPGVYYIVIEGYRGDAGLYNLTVTGCGCVADASLTCGIALNGSTVNATNYVEEIVSDCIANSNGNIRLDQKDRVYRFQAPEAKEYTFSLTNLTANLNLYLFENCLRPELCISGATSTKAGTTDESVTLFLAKNQVIFADVDGSATNVVGDFTISVSCEEEEEEPQDPLLCGQEMDGTTAGKTSNFNRNDFADCYATSFPFDGPDQLIPFEKLNASPILLTMIHSKNVNLSLIILDEDMNGVFVNGDANYRPCKGANFSTGTTRGETFQDYQDPLPSGKYYALIDGTRPNVSGAFTLSLECIGQCNIVDLNTNLDYLPLGSANAEGQSYRFSLPEHAQTTDAQNIEWVVTTGDSIISSEQGSEAILTIPNEVGKATVTVSWEKSDDPNQCFEASETICFNDPYSCDVFVWQPSSSEAGKYQFIPNTEVEVVNWIAHTANGQILEKVSTTSPSFNQSLFGSDDIFVTLTYREGGCTKVCSQAICISIPICINDQVSAVFTGTSSEVSEGKYSYQIVANIPNEADINGWHYYVVTHIDEVTKIDTNLSVINIMFDSTDAARVRYRICITYEIDDCAISCCVALDIESPFVDIDDNKIVCDPIGDNWIAKSDIMSTSLIRTFWSYGDGEIIDYSEDLTTITIPRRANQAYVYLNYLTCPFSTPDNFSTDCIWRSTAYMVPTCNVVCYDQCCDNSSGLDSIINNLPFFGCPSLDQCSFTIYQCNRTEQGDCVYDLRFDDPETIDEEGGAVYDCFGNELFSYSFFANINIDRYQELDGCKLVWEPIGGKVEECPIDSSCMVCEEFDTFISGDSIAANSSDWYVVNPTENADAIVDNEELQIRIGSGSNSPSTYVGYNLSNQSEYNVSLDVSTSRDGKIYLIGNDSNQVAVEFFPGLFGNCVVRGSDGEELSFAIQQNGEGITNFSLTFHLSETQIGITSNGLFQGNVIADTAVTSIEFCGKFGTYQVDNICIDVCEDMIYCPDDCCGTDNKSWLEDAKHILSDFCDINTDGNAIISQAKIGDRCVFILPQNPGFFDITYVVLDCSGSLVFNFGGIANINQDLFEQLTDVIPVWDCVNGDDARCEPEGFGDISAYYREKAGFNKEEVEAVQIDRLQAIFSPNPFSRGLRLAISSPMITDVDVKLLSIDGKLLYRRSHVLSIGSNLIEISSSELDLILGIVVYQVVTAEEVLTGKLIKVN